MKNMEKYLFRVKMNSNDFLLDLTLSRIFSFLPDRDLKNVQMVINFHFNFCISICINFLNN